ncbi:hypothetical protein [Actinophytocola sp.]|uniref:sunset domain-containing protein n=1 Tax=Actinophytocola sp. TaxID=1872138 RepID=UPI0025B8A064|nr:hypothetical protein [Actinophytocola sp.]
MPIFGQVWLWSSLAFLLGALLCWALVALPARRQVGELESELAARARRQPERPERPERPESRRRHLDAEELETRRALAGAGHEDDGEPLTRAYALSGSEAPGERSASGLQPAGMRSDLLVGGGLIAPPETDTTDTELADGPYAAATQYLNVGSGSLSSALEAPPEVPAEQDTSGWFGHDRDEESGEPRHTTELREPDPGEIDVRLVDDLARVEGDEPDDGGTVFTQRTHPIPGELIRQIDEAGKTESAPAHALADEPADALVDDLAEEDAQRPAEQTVESPLVSLPVSQPDAAPGESEDLFGGAAEVTSLLTPEPESTGTAAAHGAHGQTEVMPAHTTESQTEVVSARGRRPASRDLSHLGAEEPTDMPGVTGQPDPAKSPLPKRVPSKPPSRTPFGVQTTSPASPVEPAAASAVSTSSTTTTSSSSEPTRSLFEPIVPAGDAPAVPPPPHRVRDGNGRGPFGPGSAMPLPGGASPSPDFTIKASVSALRYCTPESPQFGRTVAEVWFKTPADAERVGFRPVG